jgi:hypothetical protein
MLDGGRLKSCGELVEPTEGVPEARGRCRSSFLEAARGLDSSVDQLGTRSV